MKKLSILLIVFSIVFISCNDYGKKVMIGEKNEVYYKGVDETEAKKLGNYLVEQEYFDTSSTKTIQLIKENDEYIVRFVVDEKIVNKDKAMYIKNFKVFQQMISMQVFGGKKTKIILADTKLKDIEEIGELTAEEKTAIDNQLNPSNQTQQTTPSTNNMAADSSVQNSSDDMNKDSTEN